MKVYGGVPLVGKSDISLHDAGQENCPALEVTASEVLGRVILAHWGVAPVGD